MKRKLVTLMFLILLSLIIMPDGFSQGKQDRKKRKAKRDAELVANFRAIDTLLQKQSFVIEADYLNDRYGYRVPVASNINFIHVDAGHVVLQTGTSAAVGYNGVGGITAEGNVSNWKMTKDEKRKSYTVYFNATTNLGTYDVFMKVNADATVTATITGLTRGSLTYEGSLLATYNSRVFKGQRTL